MKLNPILLTIIFFISLSVAGYAEVRTYRQVKDIATKENGKIVQSSNKGDLFECTFKVDKAKNIIVRTKVRRLDEQKARDDSTIYNIVQKKEILGSEAGNGGRALVAVRKDGGEILEISNRFAFTTRVSPFSQVITGLYRRVYDFDRDRGHDRKDNYRPQGPR
jgi:hypothetical protein